jgi:uncharacterized protein (TIGR00730 family)
MPNSLSRVCVFTGSRVGARSAYAAGAAAFGALLAKRSITLVYGGGRVGLMGIVADAALDAGGQVIGVIPEWLERKEIAHGGLTELRVVNSMHERKALMAGLSDAFVALPGGFGTFDELFEILTWAQIGLHDKAIGLLDTEGYFAPWLGLVTHAEREGFVSAENRDLFVVRDDGGLLLDALSAFEPKPVPLKWDLRKS